MKLLVTTDFSKNSKGAIRFASMFAKQTKVEEVVFYHSVYIMKPNGWGEIFYEGYKNEEIERLTDDLRKFVNLTLGKGKANFSKISIVVENSFTKDHDINTFAQKNNIDFICIATQGAGLIRKIIGTYTSYLVNSSKVPVLVIPSHYRSKSIKKVTYLSDFENLENELNTISSFSEKISVKVEVLHYAPKNDNNEKLSKNLALFNTPKFKKNNLTIQNTDLDLSLVERVAKYVNTSKPDLLIMFTKREKSFFESIFLPSKTIDLSYSTKVPVLIYSK